jgi:lysophospholipase L1-like esterase
MKKHVKPGLFLALLAFFSPVQAQDWPALGHFAEANASLDPPKTGENRVVFMGNSITIGWQSAMPDFFKDQPYINRGISGQTTPQMLLRFRQDVIALQPEVVVILAGTNDIAGNTGPATSDMIKDNIISMTELARANDIAVVLSSVLPAHDYPWRPGLGPDKKIPALNKKLKAYAAASDVVYLDYYTALANEENGMDADLAKDGVHPTRKGYELMAPLAEAAIKKALAKKNETH